MDADRFDLFVRVLAATPSRRLLTRALTGLSVAGGLGALLGPSDAEARKKKRKHKKNKRKKKCKGQKKCGKKCIPTTSCCTSAECDGGATCQNGACRCPTGQKDCQGTCVASDACCSDDSCPGGSLCQSGVCESCINTPCLNDDECCWGYCLNPGPQICACTTGDGNCIASRDCCSRSCAAGKCACDPPGTICFDGAACCSGSCPFPPGETVGFCD